MKKALLMTLAVLAVVVIALAAEWHYSSDMEAHIESVNSHIRMAQLDSALYTGLVGSIQAMTDEADISREIFETREHVHTLKDEVLAWRIRQAAEEGLNVGGAIQAVLAKWPEIV